MSDSSSSSLPEPVLPAAATEASRQRFDVALALAETCPLKLGRELAITGSTARGLADDHSDLELNLWDSELPPVEARVEWLEDAGLTDIIVYDQPRPDESYWIGGVAIDIPVEVGWQTFRALEDRLSVLRAGTITNRKALALADIVASAIPLRSNGNLARWQNMLGKYADPLQAALVELAVGLWAGRGRINRAIKLAENHERLLLVEHLSADVDALLRLIYAVYRRWEPQRKWTQSVARTFVTQPADLDGRIDAVFGAPPRDSVILWLELALEVLDLVPDRYDVHEVVAEFSAALQALKAVPTDTADPADLG
ncbi:MAG: hypothetical protein GYB67_02960 [Chloroflexi bacterium]|nr:hypothetical protein [Chloroflexota bacterium]